MRQPIKLLKISTLLLLLLFAFSTTSYAATDYINVYESWNGVSVATFSVDTSYEDIIGFAVGTNYSFVAGAAVDFSASNPAPSDWIGDAAVKSGGTTWQKVIPGAPPTLAALPGFIDLSLLSGYNSAFVFYSTTGLNPLDATFTNGFSGYVFNDDSVFVAFRSGGGIITDETSIVPIPGAAILLFSGLVGLVGIRRKR